MGNPERHPAVVRSFEDLRVWQAAAALALDVYRLSRAFPKSEAFGPTSQARRASVSVAANIAEGHGREHRGDYVRHLSIARGSLMELRTHLFLARNLFAASARAVEGAENQARNVSRMLSGLLNALRPRQVRP